MKKIKVKKNHVHGAPEPQSHFLPSTQGNVQRSGKRKEPKPGTQAHGGPGGQQSLSAPVPPPQAYLEAGHTGLGRLMTNRIRETFQGPLTAPGENSRPEGVIWTPAPLESPRKADI